MDLRFDTDIDQHVTIHEVHRLRLGTPPRLFPQKTGMTRTVRNLRSRADKSFALPVGNQFGAATQGETGTASASKKASSVLWKWQAEAVGFGR